MRRACVIAGAVPPSNGSPFNSSSSSGGSAGPGEAAAEDHADADYAELAEDDNIIMLGSADEDDDDYDSYDGYSSIGSRAAAAAGLQSPAGQVVSSSMSEDEFRAAMAAARQQVRAAQVCIA